MPRLPRQIKMDADGLHHLRGQVAGPAGYYPLQVPENADRLLATIHRYTGPFFCQVTRKTVSPISPISHSVSDRRIPLVLYCLQFHQFRSS